MYPNFDLGPEVKISNFENRKSAFLTIFWKVDIFKIRYFNFWGLNQNSGK